MRPPLILSVVLDTRRPDFRLGVGSAIVGVFALVLALIMPNTSCSSGYSDSSGTASSHCAGTNLGDIFAFFFMLLSFIPLVLQWLKLRRLQSCVRMEAMGDYHAALKIAQRYASPTLLAFFREKYNLNRRPVQQYAQQSNPPMQHMPPQMNYGTFAVPQIINIHNSNHAHNTNNAHHIHNNQTMNVHDSVVQGSLGTNNQQPPKNG